MSHGVTASELPLYMDLAGRAFFSLSHGGFSAGICQESACHEFACAPVAASKPALEGLALAFPLTGW